MSSPDQDQQPFRYEQYPEPSNLPQAPAPQAPPPPRPLPVPVAYAGTPLTDQQPISTAVVVIAWLVTFFSVLYMLPWAIAASRGKANQWTVCLVTFFLGWTGIGWIVGLVLACTAHRPIAAITGYLPSAGYVPVGALAPAAPPAGWYPNPGGPGRRYWDGYAWTQHYA